MRIRSAIDDAWRANPGLFDPTVSAAVGSLAVVQALGLLAPGHTIASVDPVLAGLAVAGSLPIAARRRFPVFVLLVIGTAVALWIIRVYPSLQVGGFVVGILGLLIAVYTVAVQQGRPRSLYLTGAVLVVNDLIYLALLLIGRTDAIHNATLLTIAVAGSWALGDNVGTRRAYLSALEERARHLEREQEQRAQRAALDERARIARELHDVVAHHVSAIAVQASAAEEIAEGDPRRARLALSAIQAASRQALAEMRAIVGILREPNDDDDLLPQPSLAQVDRLAAQSRAAGLEVEVVLEGTPRRVPEPIGLSAYRIVQEALTNTLKHARATRATVTIRYEPAVLDIDVVDDGIGVDSPRRSSGRGLVGMRERVALFRGTLDLGTASEGGFRVHGRLPLDGTDR
ncbi:MAG TPA: sensor histidine kinase [Candidatus Dormibacteraeota bacterium]|nr:sensor histidine kinase [Candidatus Dormibacteraeota bacterium]